MSVVIDTNVAMVANGRHAAAASTCITDCIDALLKSRDERILIDDQYFIIDEYKRNLSFAGQPGPGDAFFKWLWSNHANPDHCKQVSISRIYGPSSREFEEFPDDPELSDFDRSDQKFVAVALASQDNSEILNACDTDWWNFRVPLERYGVRVRFICLELMGN